MRSMINSGQNNSHKHLVNRLDVVSELSVSEPSYGINALRYEVRARGFVVGQT